MFYEDRLYGVIEIKDRVILDLINSAVLQRLKDIDQAGYIDPYFPGTRHSRFEHSLGVCILLRKYGASLEEQIAGLIHDVSHSAFSHCVDYVLEEGSETSHSYQDAILQDFVRQTEIPSILQKHSIDWKYILDDSRFPLKERPLPDLCADRIDYSLRTALIFKELSLTEVLYFLDHLATENNFWVFQDFESAQKYAELFRRLNRKYYAGLISAVMFKTAGECLRYALSKNYITVADLYTTDQKVIEKISGYLEEDRQLRRLWDRMNNKVGFTNNRRNYDSRVFCKSRIVDPLCRHKGTLKRVSDINPEWGEIVKQELKPKEYFIKFSE